MDGDGCVELTDPLYQSDLKTEPRFQKRLQLSDIMAWTFSVLTGRVGGVQKLLACDTAGRLKVADDAAAAALATLHTDITNKQSRMIVDVGGVQWLKVDANNCLHAGIWKGSQQAYVKAANNGAASTGGLCISNYYLKELYDIFTDVYDSTNHWLKVHETT